VFGSGEQSRCFAHVADVVTAMVKLIETPAAVGEVFNIGGDHEVTMNELAELVREAAGSRSEIRHVPYDEAYADGFEDMQRRVPDVRKLERVIGIRPSSPLATMIRDVVDDQRAQSSGG
jgi:UDP-glucose 4-epimerase